MNEHLRPAFEMLFELEKAGIDYWVYGGISIAACAEGFIRSNKDVDVFVKSDDYDKAKSLLKSHSSRFNCTTKEYPAKSADNKPKIEMRTHSQQKEILSIIPIFLEDGFVKFKYPGKPELYPSAILERVERTCSGYRFFTPPDPFIKWIFVNHIKTRPGKKSRPDFKADAKAILSPEELHKLRWIID